MGGGGNGLNEWRASCCTSFSVLVVSLRGGLPGRGGGGREASQGGPGKVA